MIRRLATIAAFALAGLTVPVAAFWPYASAAPQRRVVVVEAAAPPLAMDYTFPAGTSYWTNPIVITGQVGMTLKGQRSNRGPSRMVYRGPPVAAPIQFVGCTRCNLLDLEIIDEAGCDATVLVTNAVNPNAEGFSTANVFRNVRVLLSGNGKASKRAFSVDSYAAGGRDGNNDHHHFERCLAQSYTEAGFYVRGSQCHDLIFAGCAALDYGGRRPVGFHAADGVFFTWRDGAMNSNSTDFLLGTAEVQLVIDGHNSENAERFLVYPHASGMLSANVANVQWRGKPSPNKPAVDVGGPGPWTFRNVYLSGLTGNCPMMRFAGGDGAVDLTGIRLWQHGGTLPTAPLVTVPPGFETRVHGLRYQQIKDDGGRVNRRIVVNAASVQ